MGWIKSVAASLCFLITGSVMGQYNYDYLHYYPEFEKDRSNQLLFVFNSINFLKNNEYSGDIIEGYTLIGYSVEPALMYYAGDRLRIRAGIHVQKYNGMEHFSHVRPVLSAHLALTPTTHIIMGALSGHIHHRMPEPLFEPEKQFTRPVEAGLQVLINKPRFWMDSWVDWEKFVQLGDEFPEKFTFGLSTQTLLRDPLSEWQISLPVNILATHTGGQISNYPEPVQTISNAGVGVHLDRQWFQFVTRAGFFGYHLRYRNMSDENKLGINNGYAWYAGASLESKRGNALLGYFRGNDFIAPMGSRLFQSISGINPDWYQPLRNLLVGKIDYHRTFLKQIKFTFRTETYYDLDQRRLDFSNTVQLTFTPQFFITKASFF